MNWNLLAVIVGSASICLDVFLGLTWFTVSIGFLVGMNLSILIKDALQKGDE